MTDYFTNGIEHLSMISLICQFSCNGGDLNPVGGKEGFLGRKLLRKKHSDWRGRIRNNAQFSAQGRHAKIVHKLSNSLFPGSPTFCLKYLFLFFSFPPSLSHSPCVSVSQHFLCPHCLGFIRLWSDHQVGSPLLVQRSLLLTVPRGGGVGCAGPEERTVTARVMFPGKEWARWEGETRLRMV